MTATAVVTRRRVPQLAIWSIILAALPLVLTLLGFGLSAVLRSATSNPVYLTLLLAWNAIPILWLVSIAIGIVTVVLKRLGRWRIAGILAIGLPVLEAAFVLWFISQLVI